MKHVEQLSQYKTFDDYLKWAQIDVVNYGVDGWEPGNSKAKNNLTISNVNKFKDNMLA